MKIFFTMISRTVQLLAVLFTNCSLVCCTFAHFPENSTQLTGADYVVRYLNFLLVRSFFPKIQNLGLEITHFGEFGGKIEIIVTSADTELPIIGL